MTLDYLAGFLAANALFAISCLCFFYKDTLWEFELASRMAMRFPAEYLKRGPGFEIMYNVNGLLALTSALYIVLQAAFGNLG